MADQERSLETVDEISVLQEGVIATCETFHEDIAAASANLRELKLAKSQRIFNVAQPVPNFVGRTKELEDIEGFIESGEKCLALTQASAISGLGGVGKTQLARKVAFEYFNSEDCNAVWINAETNASLRSSFQNVAKEMRIEIRELNSNSKAENLIQEIVYDVYRHLAQRKTLLVFDNAELYDDIHHLMPWYHFPTCRHLHVLITSRNSFLEEESDERIRVIQLEKFTRDEAAKYVKQVLDISSEDESITRDIDDLTKLMDYFPLGLSQAVAYIRNTQLREKEFGIREYIDMFKENKAALYDYHRKYDPYKMTILTTWKITFDAIQKNESLGERALELIYMMAFLAPCSIMVKQFFLRNDEDEKRFWDALDLLEKYSITNMVEGMTSVHRLVRDVLQIWLERREETEIHLAKVLDLKGLWFSFVVWDYEFGLDHILTFLDKACNYQDIIVQLFKKDKELSIRILKNLALRDLKDPVEKLIEQLKATNNFTPEYETEIVYTAVKYGSESILEYLEPDKLRLWFHYLVSRTICLDKHSHAQLRSFLAKNVELSKTFIDSEFDYSCSYERTTALECAVASRDFKLTQMLVEFGSNVNPNSEYNMTPLQRASEKGALEIVKYLVEKGADINAIYCQYFTPLSFACISTSTHSNDIISYLLKTAADKGLVLTGKEFAFYFAVHKRHFDRARLIFDSGIDVNKGPRCEDNPFHNIAGANKLDFEDVVDQAEVCTTILNKATKSMLYTAIDKDYPGIVCWLFTLRNSFKVSDDDLLDPAITAIRKGRLEILHLFYMYPRATSVIDTIQSRYGEAPKDWILNFKYGEEEDEAAEVEKEEEQQDDDEERED